MVVFYFSFFFFLPEDREEGDCVGYARGIKTKTDRTIKHAHKKKKTHNSAQTPRDDISRE
jgi:hypothetical protein